MKGSRRICIVTSGALGSNPRVVKEAQTLVDAGFEVTVISTRTMDLVDRLDQDVLKRARWHSRRLNFRSRWKWRGLRALQLVFARAYRVTKWYPFADRGLSAFTGSLMTAAKYIKADLYVAHYPAALPAAARAARTNRALYAFDAEDFHFGDLPDGGAYEPERQIIRAIEERYLRGCSYVTAASPGIADAYADMYGISRPTVVLNVFSRAHAPTAATPKGTAIPGPSVYWFSQTIGPDRGLECALRAVARARSRPYLYLRGAPANGYREQLQQLALQLGVADRLHFLPTAPPSMMEHLAADYDIGFVGELGQTVSRRIALTNKQFTYLLAGIPAVMSDIPAHRAFSKFAGAAARLYVVDNVESLAATLDTLLGDAVALAEARAAAWKLGTERFNWEVEQVSLLDGVTSVCGPYNSSFR